MEHQGKHVASSTSEIGALLCAPLRQERIPRWQGSCVADNIMRQIPEAMLKRQKAAHLKEANINIQRFVAVT